MNTNYLKWKKWEQDQFASFSKSDERYFSKIIQYKKREENQLIVEIGYGNGKFMGFCKEKGIEIIGIEIDQELINTAKANKFSVITLDDFRKMEDGSVDMIVALDVLEHLDETQIIDCFTIAKCKLKKGGRMIARFPNGDSPMSMYQQNGDITHKTYMGYCKIEQLLLMCDLAKYEIVGDFPSIFGSGFFSSFRRLINRLSVIFLNRIVKELFLFGAKVYYFNSCLLLTVTKK